MTEKTNSEYFAARAIAEQLQSKCATDPRAASIHAAMAARYSELAAEFEEKEALPDRHIDNVFLHPTAILAAAS